MNARTRVKMCGTKIRYKTPLDAAKAIEYHRVTWKVLMRAYSCPVCGWMHLSRKEER
jgi:hypothetical protein